MSKVRQLALDLPGRPAQGREDFFVAPANQLAVAKLDLWPRWSPAKLVVTGPAGSGKTHLVAVWSAVSGATVLESEELADVDLAAPPKCVAIEGVDRIAGHDAHEIALFHLHNAIMDAGGSLLMTGRMPVGHWQIALPDLTSRLAAADTVSLDPPDDALLTAVLVKLFEDRQLIVPPDVISYLVQRIDRSFTEAETIVRQLDHAAFSLRRRVTRSLAVEVLRERA